MRAIWQENSTIAAQRTAHGGKRQICLWKMPCLKKGESYDEKKSHTPHYYYSIGGDIYCVSFGFRDYGTRD
jgi:hypothetical protein